MLSPSLLIYLFTDSHIQWSFPETTETNIYNRWRVKKTKLLLQRRGVSKKWMLIKPSFRAVVKSDRVEDHYCVNSGKFQKVQIPSEASFFWKEPCSCSKCTHNDKHRLVSHILWWSGVWDIAYTTDKQLIRFWKFSAELIMSILIVLIMPRKCHDNKA